MVNQKYEFKLVQTFKLKLSVGQMSPMYLLAKWGLAKWGLAKWGLANCPLAKWGLAKCPGF